jgi:hypothetical protein
MKCANCSSDALYEYKITQKTSTLYCDAHLPKFLEERKIAGLLALTSKNKEHSDAAVSILSTSPSTPAPEPKPAKKTAKKSGE